MTTTSDEINEPGDRALVALVPPKSAAPPLRAPSPRLGPALLFLALVAIVVFGGLLITGLSGSHAAPRTPLGKLRGTSVPAMSAKDVLARISVGGNPPSDVASALVVPDRAVPTSFLRRPVNLDLYSGSVSLEVPFSARTVVTFYRLELAHLGWRVLRTDVSATGTGSTIYATFPSEDGFYWEVEVVVEPTPPSLSPALGGAGVAESSALTLHLVELNDQD